MKASNRGIAALFLFGFLFVILSPFSAIPANCAQVAIQIPVIVNIYPDAGVTEDGARDAVKEANMALKQANIKLVVVKVQNATEGDAGDNGEFNKEERKAVRTFGGMELDKLSNKKGIKICFGKTPTTESPNNPGISVHKNPTIIVQNRATSSQTGQTIAHEVGHVMTLGPGHTVTNTQNANNGGHTPNAPGETGRENLMAPSNYRSGTKLTADQISEIQTRKYFVGKCSTQFSDAFPATKDKQQYGTKTDENNDQGLHPEYFDLNQQFLVSLDGAASIQSQLTVASPLPDAISIDARYTLGIDSDQNAATGIVYTSLAGVDRIVEIVATGIFGSPGFSLTGSVLDATSMAFLAPLDSLEAVTSDSLFDYDLPGEPTETNFLFDIPKSALAIPMTATGLPVVATSGQGLSIYDESIFNIDLIRWMEDPTLDTFGNGAPSPGDPYAFSVSGLSASSPFNLFLDDAIVLSGVLDGAGGYTGSFTFPLGVPTGTFHFLTLQDETGEFAYSMTCPTPEPLSVLLLGAGFGLLALGRLRKNAGIDLQAG